MWVGAGIERKRVKKRKRERAMWNEERKKNNLLLQERNSKDY